MSLSESPADPFGRIADQFMQDIRDGANPTVDDYALRHPDFEEQIRDLLPTLLLMEQVNTFDDSESEGVQTPVQPILDRELGDYRIIREIGRGGMGIVYEAEQISLGRHVALKILPNSAGGSSNSAIRFEREARAAARLHHTNIVPVFAVGVEEGLSYYVMQFINGISLNEILIQLKRLDGSTDPQSGVLTNIVEQSREGLSAVYGQRREAAQDSESRPHSNVPTIESASESSASTASRDSITMEFLADTGVQHSLNSSGVSSKDSSASFSGARQYWRNVAQIGWQVAEALQYAHEQGIVHRDIKPANLLLDVHNVIWVTDFGLAKLEEQQDITRDGDVLGTIRYMPPEAFDGKYDARSDVYSLGITLYELLTLRPAFSSSNRHELIKLVSQGVPQQIRKLKPHVPRDLATIVHKSIEQDADDRYSTADEFAEDLRRFMADESIVARRTPYHERLRRWSRRNRGLAASLACVAGLLLILSVGSFFAAVHFRNQQELANRLVARNQRLLEEKQAALDDSVAASRNLEIAREIAVEQKEVAVRNLFNADMGAAQRTIAGHRGLSRTAKELVKWIPEADEPDFRDWGWYYLVARCRQEDFSLSRHTHEVRSVSGSPDGKLVASVGLDKLLCIWDLEQRALVKEYQLGGSAASVHWHPQGGSLAVGMRNGITVFNTSDWTVKTQIRLRRNVLGVRFQPHGSLLACIVTRAGDRPAQVIIVDAETRETAATLKLRTTGLYSINMDWSLDGQMLAFPNDTDVIFWNVKNQKVVRRWKAHHEEVQAIQFHPDDATLLATSGRDSLAHVWDISAKPKKRTTLQGHTHAVSTLYWHPEGNRIATASWDGTIRTWFASSGQQEHLYQGHWCHTFGISWSHDGDSLISGGDDFLVKQWKSRGPNTRQHIGVHAENDPLPHIRTLSFSPDGKKLLVGCAGITVILVDTTTGSVEWRESISRSFNMLFAKFNRDGKHFATVSRDGYIRIWNTANREVRYQRRVFEAESRLAPYFAADWSPTGEHFAVAGEAGNIQVLNSDLANHASFQAQMPKTIDIKFSPDGKQILCVGHDRHVEIRDLKGNLIRRKAFGPVIENMHMWRGDWSPDGKRIALTGKVASVYFWNLDTDAVSEARLGHFEFLPSICWNPNGTRVLTADARGTLKIWDPDSQTPTLTLSATTGELRSAIWSPDGKRIAAAADGTLTIWDATNGYELSKSGADAIIHAVGR